MPSRSLILERERVNADDKYSTHTQDPLSLTSTNTKQSVLCCLTNTSTRSLSTRERIVCRGLLSAAITATLPFARLCLRYQSRDSLSLSLGELAKVSPHTHRSAAWWRSMFSAGWTANSWSGVRQYQSRQTLFRSYTPFVVVVIVVVVLRSSDADSVLLLLLVPLCISRWSASRAWINLRGSPLQRVRGRRASSPSVAVCFYSCVSSSSVPFRVYRFVVWGGSRIVSYSLLLLCFVCAKVSWIELVGIPLSVVYNRLLSRSGGWVRVTVVVGETSCLGLFWGSCFDSLSFQLHWVVLVRWCIAVCTLVYHLFFFFVRNDNVI